MSRTPQIRELATDHVIDAWLAYEAKSTEVVSLCMKTAISDEREGEKR